MYQGRTPTVSSKHAKFKKIGGGPIFEGWAGMIIYQLSQIGFMLQLLREKKKNATAFNSIILCTNVS
jgi:hypothetical protein